MLYLLIGVTNSESLMWCLSPRDQPGGSDYIESFLSQKGQFFVLIGNRHLPQMWICLPCWQHFCQNHHGFTEGLIHHCSGPHRITSDQGTHLRANEDQQWAHAYYIHWPHNVPHLLQAVGLIEFWNKPSEDSLWH